MTYLININILGIILMYIDKQKAIHNKWRIKEKTLILISTIGGCFGILIGMHLFHHKTKKLKFLLVYLISIIWILLILTTFTNY